MGTDIDRHAQVAGRSTVEARIALAADIDDLAVVDARRDADFHLVSLPDMAAAAAFGAGLLDDGTLSVAAGADLGGGNHAERRALLGADLTTPVTFRAGLGRRAFRSTRAAAFVANLHTHRLDRALAALCRLFK